MKKINIGHMGHAHNDWLRGLDFYRQELDILKGRLTQIGGNYTSPEVSSLVEQFENRFIVQKDNIDRLEHQINEHVTAISKEAQQDHAQYVDGKLGERYMELSDEYTTEEKVVNELRNEFNRFSAAWM